MSLTSINLLDVDVLHCIANCDFLFFRIVGVLCPPTPGVNVRNVNGMNSPESCHSPRFVSCSRAKNASRLPPAGRCPWHPWNLGPGWNECQRAYTCTHMYGDETFSKCHHCAYSKIKDGTIPFVLQNIFSFFQKPKKDMGSVSPHSTVVLVAQKVKLHLSGFCAQHRLWGQSSSASSWRLVSHLPCSAIACCKVSSSCLAPVKINAICRSVDYVAAASPPPVFCKLLYWQPIIWPSRFSSLVCAQKRASMAKSGRDSISFVCLKIGLTKKKLNLLSLRSQDNKNKGILRFWGLLWQFVRSRTISESQETLNWTDSVARPLPIDRASFETQTWAINMHSRCPIAGQLAAHKVLHLHFSRVFNVSVKSKSLLLSQGKKW